MEYAERIDELKARYEPRVQALLQGVADDLIAAGYELWSDETNGAHRNVADCSDDEYCWGISTEYGLTNADTWGWEVYLTEERQREDADGTGVSFMLTGDYNGGHILSSWAPHNYSDEVWVDAFDDEAVEARWREFEDMIVGSTFVERLREVGIEPVAAV